MGWRRRGGKSVEKLDLDGWEVKAARQEGQVEAKARRSGKDTNIERME